MRERFFVGRGWSVAAAIALLVAALPAAAAQIEVPTTVTEIPEAPELVIQDGKLMMQLEDAVMLALRRNLDLAVERYGHEQSLIDVLGSKGIYDLQIGADVSVRNSEFPTAVRIEGVPVIKSDNHSADVTLQQLTPYGGEAAFNLNLDRSSSNSLNQLLNPEYGADGGFRFTQPLLRGFGTLPTNRPILLARLGSGMSREQFEQRVALVLQQVEDAYWNLVESRDQLQVAQQSLQLAQELHQRNKIQVDVGTLAPIELVQSEATIATRQEGIISTGAAVRDAEDALLELLNLPTAMAEGLEIEPRTPPATEPVDIDVQQAIQTALAERPELAQQRLQVESLEVDSRFFHNQKLPVTNLVATYGGTGIAGRPTPGSEDVAGPNTGLSDAVADVFGFDFPTWTVALNFSVPLQNRSARAQSTVADLDLERGRTQLRQLELGVITDVRTTARAVRTAQQQIESARASVRLQQKNLEAEQKRYENGMSTSFRITQIQDDLTQARSREVSAVTNYRRALAAYYRATGRLLEQNGVELAGPVDVELPSGSVFSLFH